MLPIHLLEPHEIDLVKRSLQAAASGPFFPDWEFDTLFGLSRDDLRSVAASWPENAAEPETEAAVHNTLANLSGYPHKREQDLERMLAVAPTALRELIQKLDTAE